jgi:probable rRNA maturation factor
LSVSIQNRQRRLLVSPTRLRRLAARVLAAVGRSDSDVDVVVVDDREIRRLNRRYLGARGATDVLAFDLTLRVDSAAAAPAGNQETRTGVRPNHRPTPLVGEVIISGETAARQAARLGVPAHLELDLLLVHGLLHLAGYDDHAPADARAMHEREREILSASGRRAVPDRLFSGLLESSGQPRRSGEPRRDRATARARRRRVHVR